MTKILTPSERRTAIKTILKSPDNLYQFGQPHMTTTNVGAGSTGCTHVILRALVRIWNDRDVTVDEISAVAGYTTAQLKAHEGMTGPQVTRVFAHYKLPYRQMLGTLGTDLRLVVDNTGPVMMAVGYDFYPEWRGYDYQGTKADGYPNGYSVPLGKSGRNQVTGAGFGHCVLAIGRRDRSDLRQHLNRWWMHDPNHTSQARPEKTAVDVITEEQLDSMLNRFPHFSKSANATVVWIPSEQWNGART